MAQEISATNLLIAVIVVCIIILLGAYSFPFHATSTLGNSMLSLVMPPPSLEGQWAIIRPPTLDISSGKPKVHPPKLLYDEYFTVLKDQSLQPSGNLRFIGIIHNFMKYYTIKHTETLKNTGGAKRVTKLELITYENGQATILMNHDLIDIGVSKPYYIHSYPFAFRMDGFIIDAVLYDFYIAEAILKSI
jgi:hypothetical protein